MDRCGCGLRQLPFAHIQSTVVHSSNHLKHLLLCGVVGLSDGQLLSLVPHLHRLETLDLSRCRRLTDTGVRPTRLFSTIQHVYHSAC